jgi:hypothetical protein
MDLERLDCHDSFAQEYLLALPAAFRPTRRPGVPGQDRWSSGSPPLVADDPSVLAAAAGDQIFTPRGRTPPAPRQQLASGLPGEHGVQHRLADLAGHARSLRSARDPGAALLEFVDHLVLETAPKRDLVDALTSAGLPAGDAVMAVIRDGLRAPASEQRGR